MSTLVEMFEQSHLDQLQNKVRVFAVQFGRETLETAAEPSLLLLHQVLTRFVQLHSHTKLIFSTRDTGQRESEAGFIEIQQEEGGILGHFL